MKKLSVLYINGLGSGKLSAKDRLVIWWWKRAGVDFHHAQVDWYGEQSFDDLLSRVVTQADEIMKQSEQVIVIGSSAGGSLALNTFFQLRHKNIYAVNAHGRLRAGTFANKHFNSLYRRAKLDTNKPAQGFYDSVMYAENTVLPKLTSGDKRRILVLSQLTDLVVPINLMLIDGVREYRSLAFGHSGGFVAHLFADRDLIIHYLVTHK